MANFETAVNIVLANEGGYVNNSKDPGGETKYGISKRSYPKLDIKNLTVQTAKTLYRRDFWNALNGDQILSQAVANQALDIAVLHGVGTAKEWLKGFLKDNGIPVTSGKTISVSDTNSLNKVNPSIVNNYLINKRKQKYTQLATANPKLKAFLPGWINRSNSFTSSAAVSISTIGLGTLIILYLVAKNLIKG